MKKARQVRRKGMELEIFQDPLTRRIEEGRAKLVQFLRARDDVIDGARCHSEDWRVEFLQEKGATYERTIAWV